MRITSKGQVTIPVAIRERAGLMPNTEVEFTYDGGDVLIRRLRRGKRGSKPTRGERIVAHLRAHPGTGTMTTDEILALMREE
jgi:AbrB family looped-hinge helix DNA binding protein